jgi:hypothetical protein
VLLAVGQRLAQGLRRTDLAVRYGGDEFALLFGEMSLAQAEKRLEAIVSDLAAARYEYDHDGTPSSVEFTVSCGVVEPPPGEWAGGVRPRARGRGRGGPPPPAARRRSPNSTCRASETMRSP